MVITFQASLMTLWASNLLSGVLGRIPHPALLDRKEFPFFQPILAYCLEAGLTLECLSIWTAFLDLAHLISPISLPQSRLLLDLAYSHLPDALSLVTGDSIWDASTPSILPTPQPPSPGLALGFSSL